MFIVPFRWALHKHFIGIAGHFIHQIFKITVVLSCMSISWQKLQIIITQVLKYSENVEQTCTEILVIYLLLRDQMCQVQIFWSLNGHRHHRNWAIKNFGRKNILVYLKNKGFVQKT